MVGSMRTEFQKKARGSATRVALAEGHMPLLIEEVKVHGVTCRKEGTRLLFFLFAVLFGRFR